MGLTNGIILHLISDLNFPSEMIGAQTIKFLSLIWVFLVFILFY